MSQTGRHLVFFRNGALADTAKMARDVAGIAMASSAAEAENATISGEWRESDTIVIPVLNVAAIAADLDQVQRLGTSSGSPICLIRPEYYFSIATLGGVPASYLRGYRDGVNAVAARLLGTDGPDGEAELEFVAQDDPAFTDSAELTWGLQAVGLPKTTLTGRGVRVAVLDTGVDFNHPDFVNRGLKERSASFVPGSADAQDDHGHGTHCLGTVAGPKVPRTGPRYGVACDAEVFVAKVLDATGDGREGDILHGIGWALQHGVRVISMSFGKRVERGVVADSGYDDIGAIALSKNCLLTAAAGNDSLRPNEIEPVEMPANAKTFMAIGAVSRRLMMFPKSNGSVNPNGGKIDLVGPGVEVHSSKPLPIEYGFASGTSMATPHIAGVAAIMMEQDPSATAEQIWTRLTQHARRLPLPNRDVGAGLAAVS